MKTNPHKPRSSILDEPRVLSSTLYPLEDFCARPHRDPPQTGKMTMQKLLRLIRAGYGQGHLHRYKSWLRVTKHDYSPVSNVGHMQSNIKGRLHHVRALSEARSAILLYWLGALDLRDQYPVWPWPHDHLSWGLDGQQRLPKLPGLMEIAREASIDHGVYLGTTLPYVATLDLVSTWRKADGGYYFVAHECKPRDLVFDADPLSRTKERLQLTRLYLKVAELRQHLVHIEDYPSRFFVNLDALRPTITKEHQEKIRISRGYGLLIEHCSRWAYEQPVNAVLTELVRRTAANLFELQALSHLALWHQDLDHDLREPLEPWVPLRPGGRALKASLLQEWSGASA
ncbi:MULTISPECIES: hypothetical protein [Polaromonas]|uniref:TnsA endonuclease N-terminal domain-containing protein n=1 Tax=Polaromonas aquatica TaxID=332657 RepID=A0ABW1TZ43_9BURK